MTTGGLPPPGGLDGPPLGPGLGGCPPLELPAAFRSGNCRATTQELGGPRGACVDALGGKEGDMSGGMGCGVGSMGGMGGEMFGGMGCGMGRMGGLGGMGNASGMAGIGIMGGKGNGGCIVGVGNPGGCMSSWSGMGGNMGGMGPMGAMNATGGVVAGAGMPGGMGMTNMCGKGGVSETVGTGGMGGFGGMDAMCGMSRMGCMAGMGGNRDMYGIGGVCSKGGMNAVCGMPGMGGMGEMSGMGGMRFMGGMGGKGDIGGMYAMGSMMGSMCGMNSMGAMMCAMKGMGSMGGVGGTGSMNGIGGMGVAGSMEGMGNMGNMANMQNFGWLACFGPMGCMFAQRLEDSVARLGLDRGAIEALQTVSPPEAIELLASVDKNVRNPSGWITNAVKNAKERSMSRMMEMCMGMAAGGMGMTGMIGSMGGGFGGDGKGAGAGRLAGLKDSRNGSGCGDPTATAASEQGGVKEGAGVATAIVDTPPGGTLGSGPAGVGTPGCSEYGGGGSGSGAGVGGVSGSIIQELEDSIARHALDKPAIEALRSMQPKAAVALVTSIDKNVRNPSAWIKSAVKNAKEREMNGSLGVSTMGAMGSMMGATVGPMGGAMGSMGGGIGAGAMSAMSGMGGMFAMGGMGHMMGAMMGGGVGGMMGGMGTMGAMGAMGCGSGGAASMGCGTGGTAAEPCSDPAEKADKNSRTVFVGGLPKTATQETVDAYFGGFGKVNSVMLKNDLEGNFRGFGFVTFRDQSTTDAVCSHKGHKFEGKPISCRPADCQGGVDPETMFVGGLPRTATLEQVNAHFSHYGTVSSIDMKYDEDEKFRGFCFVIFEDKASAELVYRNYDENRFDGKWINCRPAVRRQLGMGENGGCPLDSTLAVALREAGPLLGLGAFGMGGGPTTAANFMAGGGILDPGSQARAAAGSAGAGGFMNCPDVAMANQMQMAALMGSAAGGGFGPMTAAMGSIARSMPY